jgi:hypothetical protein
VWIETLSRQNKDAANNVTPHAGVWIETYKLKIQEHKQNGHAPRGRVD